MNLVVLSKYRLPFWEFFFIIILFALYLLPSVSVGSTIMLMLILAYCAYLMLTDKKMLLIVLKPLLLIILLALLYALLTDASSIAQNVSNRVLKRFISKLYQYLTLYFPAVLLVRVCMRATQKQKKLFAILGIVLIIYVIIITWLFLLENPDATREWENFEENSAEGVANYFFIYAVPIIISVITIFLVKAQGAMKLIPLAGIIIGILFLVNAQYTLSILIALIGVLFQLFRNLRSTLSKVIFVCAVLLAVGFMPQILEAAIRHIDSRQITERLGEIHAFITGKGAGGYNLSGRLTLYGNTMKAFFHSPIWGNRTLGFDGHATFLTVLADTGLLGGVPFYALLVMICKTVLRYMGENKKQFKVVIAMFVMIGLTNPVHASLPVGFVTWFLAPLIIMMILKEKEKDETAMEN